MNHDSTILVHGHLDGLLTSAQEADLNAWVQAAPENALAFAAVARLHDRLYNLHRAGRDLRAHLPAEPDHPNRRWPRRRLLGGVAALVALAVAVLWSGNPPPVSAAAALDRLIAAAAAPHDRTYVIRNLDPQPEPAEERRPPLDGAILHVRPPDQYVLIRHFPDGRRFVTGSDGKCSWSVPPAGAVRVSGDPLRFRGPVPGHQHGLPFADLRTDLVHLREAYDVAAGPADEATRRLVAVKKSAAFRGPRRVELEYDPATGVIRRMVFDGLPQARGGPKRVAVELTAERDLGAAFFRHETHHAPDRRVVEED